MRARMDGYIMDEYAVVRPGKGHSLLTFPRDYTVIDIETTGLDPQWNEIIELSALRVRGGQVVDRFSSFVKPEYEIDEFITELTGITNEDVADAPAIGDILPQFLDFVGSDIVVGHNVHFDVNFIYDAAEASSGRIVSNDIVDTMRISRYVFPALAHHRLADVAAALGISQESAHRALVDCETTHAVLQGLQAAADAAGIDPLFRELVVLRASQINGCAVCVRAHTDKAVAAGATSDWLTQLTVWHESGIFSERERAALELAEALTLITREGVPDELYDRVGSVLTEAEFIAVSWLVIAINNNNRLGIAGHLPVRPRER